MNIDEERHRLENEKATIEGYLNHPITREILKDNEEEQQGLINVITVGEIVDISTFFAHFQAVGQLKGLRQSSAILRGSLERIKEELERLKDHAS